jgi:hypothetical protein
VPHLPDKRLQVRARGLQHRLDVDAVRFGLEPERAEPAEKIRRRTNDARCPRSRRATASASIGCTSPRVP